MDTFILFQKMSILNSSEWENINWATKDMKHYGD